MINLDDVRSLVDRTRGTDLQTDVALAFKLANTVPDLLTWIDDLRDSLDSVCEDCQDRCRCKRDQA